MAATFDASGTGNFVDTAATIAWGHIIDGACSLVLVFVTWKETTPSINGMYLSDVQVNGESCTFHSQITNGYTLEVWYLVSPTTTGSSTVEAFFLDAVTGLPSADGGVSGEGASVSLIATNTSFPIVRNTTRTSNEEQPQIIGHGNVPDRKMRATTTIQAAGTNNILVDSCVASSNSITPTLTVNSNQTEQWNASWGAADGYEAVNAGSTRGSAPSKIPMRWEMNDYSNFAHSVVEVRGA